jgi:hypothetical protein
MPYNTFNSYFHSPSWRSRRSKQTQSWLQLQSESIHDIPPRRPRASLNLLSIISKFEALDAISLPIKIPSLKPAPLQLSHNSSRRQTGTKASQIGKFPTIFSPRDKSTGNHDDIGSIDEFTLGRGDLSSTLDSIGAGSSPRRPRKLRKSQPSNKANTFKPRETFEAFHFQDDGSLDTVVGQEQSEEGPKRRKTIRDIINYFDGGMNVHFSFFK